MDSADRLFPLLMSTASPLAEERYPPFFQFGISKIRQN